MVIDKLAERTNTKQCFGDWEIDTIIGKKYQSVILTITERKSQFELMAKTNGTKAQSVKKNNQSFSSLLNNL